MIRTLQFYIARELFKTFALAAIGLTLLFSLCGGVMNMIEAEILTAVQIVRVMAFVLPIATTLTMPVSALFACAMVYGRFAADNEFDACKASGINIQRLLAPAFALSLLTFAFTFSFTNYIIPSFAERLDALVRKDMQKIAVHALTTQGYIMRGPYVLYAGKTAAVESESGEGDSNLVRISNAAFVEMENEDPARIGTIDEVQIIFGTDEVTREPNVGAVMYDIHAVDVLRNQYYRLDEQGIDSVRIPSTLKQEPKWLNLPDLITYGEEPEKLDVIKEKVEALRQRIRDSLFYKHVIESITGPDHMLILDDGERRYEITAGAISPGFADPALKDFQPRLANVRLKAVTPDHEREFTADSGVIRVRRGFANKVDVAMVTITLEDNVRFTDAVDPNTEATRKRFDLDAIGLDPQTYAAEAEIEDDELLITDPNILKDPLQMSSLGLGRTIDEGRIRSGREVLKLSLEIRGILHSRLAFSASVLVTLVLAAALGIIFRGGQILTAFVISFIPGLFVVVMNIMGRQLAEKSGTELIGVMIMWSAIGLVAVADGIVFTRFLRR